MRFKEWMDLREWNHVVIEGGPTALTLPGVGGKPTAYPVAQIDMRFELYHPKDWDAMVRGDGPGWQVRLPFPHAYGNYLVYAEPGEYARIGHKMPQKTVTRHSAANPNFPDRKPHTWTWLSPLNGPDHWWQRAEFQDARGEVVYYLHDGVPFEYKDFVPSHRDDLLRSQGILKDRQPTAPFFHA